MTTEREHAALEREVERLRERVEDLRYRLAESCAEIRRLRRLNARPSRREPRVTQPCASSSQNFPRDAGKVPP